MAPLRRQHGQADQALHSTETDGAFDERQAVKQLRRSFVASGEIEADHAAEAGHLPFRDRVVRMRRQTRIIDLADAAVGREELGHCLCARVMPRDAQRQRLQSAPERVRGRRIHDRAEQPPRLRDRIDEPAGPGDRAACHVAMAVQVFRRALHREVDAECQRLLVDRARERTVDDRQHTTRLADARDARNVHAAQRRVDRRLEPDDARASGYHTLEVRQIAERHEPRVNVEFREQIGEQVQRAAIDGRATYDLFARLDVRHQNGRRRALAGRKHQRRLRRVERGELLLHADDRRVGVPRIEVLRRPAFVVVEHFLRALEHERRRLVDRRGERHRVTGRRFAGVNQLRGKTLHDACPTLSPLAPTTGSMNW